MPIHCHSSPRLLINLKEPSISLNLMSDGVTTISKSKKERNGKLLSRQIEDYLNQQLCSLECAIPLQPSKE